MEDPEADHTCSKLEQVLKKKIYIYIYIYILYNLFLGVDGKFPIGHDYCVAQSLYVGRYSD